MKRQLAVFAKTVVITTLCLLIAAAALYGFFAADSRVAAAQGNAGLAALYQDISPDIEQLQIAANAAKPYLPIISPALRLVYDAARLIF